MESVDSAFLREIEGWRSTLARDLASRNELNRCQLNYAVQMTIDCIVFLRNQQKPTGNMVEPVSLIVEAIHR